MKDDTITKLYAGLTDKERAALAFDYLIPGNDIEIQRIQSAMPDQHFSGLPREYRQTFDGFLHVALFYALEYWRQVAMANIYLAGLNAMSGKITEATKHMPNDEISQNAQYQEFDAMLKLHSGHEVMLLSLEVSIDQISTDYGLNPASLRSMVGAQCYTIIGTQPGQPDLEPDPAIVAQLVKMWTDNLG